MLPVKSQVVYILLQYGLCPIYSTLPLHHKNISHNKSVFSEIGSWVDLAIVFWPLHLGLYLHYLINSHNNCVINEPKTKRLYNLSPNQKKTRVVKFKACLTLQRRENESQNTIDYLLCISLL